MRKTVDIDKVIQRALARGPLGRDALRRRVIGLILADLSPAVTEAIDRVPAELADSTGGRRASVHYASA